MSEQDAPLVHPTRPIRCGSCYELLGNGSVLPSGSLVVSDRDKRKIAPATGTESLDHARSIAQHFAVAAQHIALDREFQERDSDRWASDLQSAEYATRAALDEVRRLQGDADEVTYYFRCGGGHYPRITARRLVEAVRDSPETDLLLT